ncbi:MAG: endonuclease V [Microscillaceae bacterium]|jgi:deoxyribonuclease V|nr:endonuclease V [Microscillaceae bacterium]
MTNLSPELLAYWEAEQNRLASKILIPSAGMGYLPDVEDIILVLDIQYQGNVAAIGGVLGNPQGEIEQVFTAQVSADVPYAPGYFCFREGPPLLKFWQNLTKAQHLQPNLIILDGHGIAHPRKFGVACWLGLHTQTPCLGCAKESLLPFEGELPDNQGSSLAIKLHNEVVGWALRTQSGVKPIFASPGYALSLETAKQLIFNLKGEYRLPDILRLADQVARAQAKNELKNDWIDWGYIS